MGAQIRTDDLADANQYRWYRLAPLRPPSAQARCPRSIPAVMIGSCASRTLPRIDVGPPAGFSAHPVEATSQPPPTPFHRNRRYPKTQ
jgi:hypothetical protein